MYRGEAIRLLQRLRETLSREIAHEQKQRAAFMTMSAGWWPYAYARTRVINKLLLQKQALDIAIQSLVEGR